MELLVYMGILGIAAGLVTGILTSVTKTQIEESIQTEISGQLNFTMQTIQRLVKNSSLVDAAAGTASSTLLLKMKDVQDIADGSTNYYTKIYLSNGRIYVEEQPNSPQSITSDKVTVDSLEFKKLTQYPGKDIVQIDLAMSGVTQVEGKTISRALRSAISRVSAATFDSDLVPGSDNTYSVGTSNRWKNGIFSGNVGIGVSTLLNKLDVSGGTAIGTYAGSATAPSNGLIVSGNVGIGTTNPLQKLQIGDNSVAALGLRIAATGVNWDQVTNASSSLTIGSGAGVYLTFNKDSPYYSSFNLGNVGIGTTTPTTAGLVIATQVGTTTLDVTGGKIINLGTPVNSTDAATKAYADTAGGGSDEAVVGRGPISATFARSSVAYKQNGSSVASGAPRYETAKYANGITIEESTTNLLSAANSDIESWSGQYLQNSGGSSVWQNSAQYRTGAYSIAWSGSDLYNGWYLGGGYRFSVTAGTTYTASLWAKALSPNATTGFGLGIRFYNVSTGGSPLGSAASSVTLSYSTWNRFSVTSTAPTGSTYGDIYFVQTGALASYVYSDDIQVEAKSYPTTWHIGAGTRNAETETIPGTIINNSAGTFDAWIKLLRTPGTYLQVIFDGNGTTNHDFIIYVDTDAKVKSGYGNGSGTTTLLGTTSLVKDTLYHVAVTWTAAGAALYVNGSPEDTDATAPSITFGNPAYIGSTETGGNQLDGIIETPRIFSSALSDSDILKAASRASFTITL